MAPDSSLDDLDEMCSRGSFDALAGFRHALREFLRHSEALLKSAGVTSPQYQAMLAIEASEHRELSVKSLAHGMLLKPNGAVQLVDRLEAQGLVQRRTSPLDRRSVLVSLTHRGEQLVGALAKEHSAELMRRRPRLIDSLRSLDGSPAVRVGHS
jgi:DNA-binding MarR family transcriptional regulator